MDRITGPIKNPEKILIVKPSSLGDIVHSLPFLYSIKIHFPAARIDWVVAGGFEGLLEGHSMIHRLWVINKDAWKKISCVRNTVTEIKKLFRELKKEEYDLVIDLQGLLRSGIITKATGAPLRIGFKEAREGSRFFYTHKVEGRKDIHAVDRYLKIAEWLGCDISDVSFPLFSPGSSSSFIIQPSALKDYAVIVPGARWKTKRWSIGNFGRLSALLPFKKIIVGSAGDTALANEIVTLSDGKAVSLAGKTNLRELIAIMRGARFVVSNDSGPMHIAAALGIPVFAIFGPTDPLRTGPYGQGHTIIRSEALCSPCFRRTCDDMKCMKDLSVEMVYGAISRKIQDRSAFVQFLIPDLTDSER